MSFSRVRGDTQLQEFTLTVTANNVTTPLDLDLADKVEFSFIKPKSSTVLIRLCDKHADPLTGVCYVDFTDTDVDTAGTCVYDIQITWVGGRKTTYTVSEFKLTDDVNKT